MLPTCTYHIGYLYVIFVLSDSTEGHIALLLIYQTTVNLFIMITSDMWTYHLVIDQVNSERSLSS